MKQTLPCLLLCGLIAMLLGACAATQITSDWKEQSYQGPPRKIVVIAIAKNPGNRRIFEDEFVRRLKEHGTDAVAGYTRIPDQKQGNRQATADMMKQENADAVLITRLTDRKTVKTYVPGTMAPYGAWYDRYPSYYGTWPDYYGYGYQAMYSPGYLAEEEYALIETNLYQAGNEKLIWSAISETEIRGSDPKFIKSYVDKMIESMTKHNLIKK